MDRPEASGPKRTPIFLTLIIFCYSFIAINNSYEKFDTDDPQEIVIDEFVGQMLPLLSIPIFETLFLIPKIYYCIAALILFRLFDKNGRGGRHIEIDRIYIGENYVNSLEKKVLKWFAK